MKSFFIVFTSFLFIQFSNLQPIIPPEVEIKSEQNGESIILSNDELILAHVVSINEKSNENLLKTKGIFL